MKKLFLFFIFVFFTARLCAAPPVLLNSQDITIGDDINIKVAARNNFDLNNLAKENFGDFSLRRAQLSDTGDLILTVTAFNTGELTFPALKMLNTEPLKINIVSVLDPNNPPQDILDIKPLISFPRGLLWYIKMSGILLLLSAAAYGAYLLIKRRRPAILGMGPKPEVPPREFALAELEKLKTLNLIEQNLAKEYYDSLSDIVRFYLTRVYGRDLMEKTTSEIYNILKETFTHYDNTALRTFLQTCDFVKFAKFVPSAESANEDFQTARGLIQKL